MFRHLWPFRILFVWFLHRRNAWYSLTLRCLAHGGIFHWLFYVFAFAVANWHNMADPLRDISWKLKCSILSLLWFPFLLFITRHCDTFLYYFLMRCSNFLLSSYSCFLYFSSMPYAILLVVCIPSVPYGTNFLLVLAWKIQFRGVCCNPL